MATEIKRMRYFDGLFLKEQEFQLDQEYNLRLRRMHNRHLHGTGIAWGLEVQNGPSATEVVVKPGMAIDLYDDPTYGEETGREIIVTSDIVVDLSTKPPGTEHYVWISYDQKQTDVVADRGGSEPIHWQETGAVSTDVAKPVDPQRNLILGKVVLNGLGEVESIQEEEDGQSLRLLIATGGSGGSTTTGGTGLGKNYVRNPDAELSGNHWTDSTSLNLTVARTAEAAQVLSGSFSFQVNASAGTIAETDYVTVAMNSIDEEDKNQLFAVELSYKGLTNWDAGLLKVIIRDNTNGVDIVPNPHIIPGGQGKYRGIFTTTDSLSYEVRLVVATGGQDFLVVVDSVRVGPNNLVVGPGIGDWEPITMTIDATVTPPDPGVIVMDRAFRKRIGDSYAYKFDFHKDTGGTAGSGDYIFRPGDTFDLSKFPADNTGILGTVGLASFAHVGNNIQYGYVRMYDDSGFQMLVHIDGITFGQIGSSKGALSNTGIQYSFETVPIPIVGLSSNVILSESRTEYVYNSDSSNTDSTTDFATGEAGGLVPNWVGTVAGGTDLRRKRCRTSRPYKHYRLEFNPGGNTLWTSEKFLPQFWQNTAGVSIYYGAYIEPISPTEFDVIFQDHAHTTSTTGGSQDWQFEFNAGTTWRVVCSDNPAFVETAPREYLAATSAVKAGSDGSGTWPQLTGNSVILPPGDWQLNGFGKCSNAGGIDVGYTRMAVGWYLANGDGTTSEPTYIHPITLAGRYVRNAAPPLTSEGDIPAQTILVRVTTPTEVFLNVLGYFTHTTLADIRYWTMIYAQRMA